MSTFTVNHVLTTTYNSILTVDEGQKEWLSYKIEHTKYEDEKVFDPYNQQKMFSHQ